MNIPTMWRRDYTLNSVTKRRRMYMLTCKQSLLI